MPCSLIDNVTVFFCPEGVGSRFIQNMDTNPAEYMTLSQKAVLSVFTMRTSMAYFKLFIEVDVHSFLMESFSAFMSAWYTQFSCTV
jgi:hypothetical protein